MTAVSVSFDGTRLSDAETESSGGVWDDWSAATSPTQETDVVIQNTYCMSNKVSSTQGGVEFEDDAGVDYSTTPRVVIAKINVTTYGIMGGQHDSPAGLKYQIGSGTHATNVIDYHVAGNDYYPVTGGWLILCIDPNVLAWRDVVTGTPSLTGIDYYGLAADMTASAKTDNVMHDALDWIPSGGGLTLSGGSDTDPDGTFQDFIDYDEGNYLNRYGIVFTAAQALLVRGTLTIGDASETDFTDENRVLFFPKDYMLVDEGFFGLKCDLQASGTAITINSTVMQGNHQDDFVAFFDTEYEVDGTNEELDLTAHDFVTGDYVQYRKQGGSEAIGLTDNSYYWVEVITANSICLHTSRANAFAAATPVGLTASTTGNGEEHLIQRYPDLRPDLTISGATGYAVFDGCTFIRFRNIKTTSTCTIKDSKMVYPDYLDLTTSGGFLLRNLFQFPATVRGESFIVCDDLGDIDSCAFVSGGEGHAIEIDTATAGVAFYATTFDLYFDGDEDNTGGISFNPSTDIDDTNDEIDYTSHPLNTGDPIYYSDEGGTPVSGLTDGSLYYARYVTASSFSLHPTLYAATNGVNKIAISTGSNETHKFYSANAAIHNSSGGHVTINVQDAGDSPSVRNSNGSTTTVNNTVTLSVTNVRGGSQVSIRKASDNSEIMNKEAVPTSRFWSEKFEDTGYDETWSGSEVVGGSSTFDEDYAVSSVTGAPSDWEDECLQVVTASTENAYIENTFGSDKGGPNYFRCEVIVDSESLGTSTGVTFARGATSTPNTMWELSIYQNASDDLVIRANIRHDGSDNFYESDPISLDTRYIVEVYWDEIADEWAWRIGDEDWTITTLYSGSLTSTAATWVLRTVRMGTTAAGGVVTYYLDCFEIDDTDWVKSSDGLTSVSKTDYNYTGETAVYVYVRRSSRTPKYKTWTGGGNIVSTGLSVQAAQVRDDVAAP